MKAQQINEKGKGDALWLNHHEGQLLKLTGKISPFCLNYKVTEIKCFQPPYFGVTSVSAPHALSK